MNPTESPDRSYWESWRLGVWALGLSVLSVVVQLEYFMVEEGGGPILVAVLAGSIFRIMFLLFVIYRLHRTPEPQPGTSAFESGHGVRGVIVQTWTLLGFIWQGFWFFGFLTAGVWVGMITTMLWVVWLRGMGVRENARCWQLEEMKNAR
ncbi:MAG: hypothetical protein JWL81_2538 [Verrucomicrobiales bacterium]|nr:hypothetical protein [Verrucomicrobiales bacterium]